MKNLIYYPTFEPHNLTWLKYALLYVEDFSPIIPVKGNNELSDIFRQIRDSTELIRSIEPTGQQGESATAKAIEQIESIRAYPDRYASLFNAPKIFNVWADPVSWREKLYREKFSDPFEEYCIQNGLGRPVSEGLQLSHELAGFYMTFLAEQIAFERKASPITDLPELDGISTFLRTKDVDLENRWTARVATIDMQLPGGIDDIAIDNFISFRNHSEINELRISYNKTIDDFYTSVEQNYDPFTYLETLRTLNKSLIKEMVAFFGGTTVFAMNCFLATAHPLQAAEVIEKVFEGGVALTGLAGMKKEWKLGADRRNARKFLSLVGELKG